jgi:hypothetical protein
MLRKRIGLNCSFDESKWSHSKQDKIHVSIYFTYARMSAFCHIDFYYVGVAGVTPKRHDVHTDFIACAPDSKADSSLYNNNTYASTGIEYFLLTKERKKNEDGRFVSTKFM